MRRVSSFLLRLTIIGVLLHVYVGFRLLPELAAPPRATRARCGSSGRAC
ncbi:unnamed protein product [Burkholderia pseudomallei]|nr:unnamed protein product [Burkholderia pseudomallei]